MEPAVHGAQPTETRQRVGMKSGEGSLESPSRPRSGQENQALSHFLDRLLGRGNNLPPNRSWSAKYVIALTQEGVPQPKQDFLCKAGAVTPVPSTIPVYVSRI
jgi:hypothetical protein